VEVGVLAKLNRPFLAHIVPALATRIAHGMCMRETTGGEKLERVKLGKYNKSILAEVHLGALATGPYRRRRRRRS
jgi:hypothetical protein